MNRRLALRELEGLFRGGRVPDPLPDGLLHGAVLGTCVWGPLDAAFARVAAAWMPWRGKVFDAASGTGVNRFDPSFRLPMRLLWPSHRPTRGAPTFVEAFRFRLRVGPGAADPDVRVCRIEYDVEGNPRFLVSRIVDELVQVDEGLYLGKAFLRVGSTPRRVGFFTLTRSASSPAGR